jgi:transposase
MIIEKDKLPDDIELLKRMLTESAEQYSLLEEKHLFLSKEYSSLNKEYSSLNENYSSLEEKYNYLRKYFFGSKSEKLTTEDEIQLRLFNEAEEGCSAEEADAITPEEELEEELFEKTQVKGHTRKKGGKKKLPDYLPREEIVHDLTAEEKSCPCCGKDRPVIGEDSTEELDIIPPKIIVNKHIRKKYGACSCDRFFEEEIPEIKTASMPERFMPYSIASSGLVAYIITAKFCDALPFYRQSKIFNRMDIELSRATLCNWAMLAADKCSKLIDIMTEEMIESPVIGMDETTFQVLKEPDRPAQSKSYMWVARAYTPEGKIFVLYQYHPTRSGEVPKKILGDYGGFLQTDGYAGYNQIGRQDKIIHVGCFAHVRHEFEKARVKNKKSKTAFKALNFIRSLYKIENELREKNYLPDVFVEKRKSAVLPILEEFHNWLVSQKQKILPKGYAGDAVNYTLNQWNKLIKYLDHHLLTPDNNTVENKIRPFTVGRKNWLFSNTPNGANASAILYSLVETAKANGLEPYRYLRYLFDRLPFAKSKEELRLLLPDTITPEMIKI